MLKLKKIYIYKRKYVQVALALKFNFAHQLSQIWFAFLTKKKLIKNEIKHAQDRYRVPGCGTGSNRFWDRVQKFWNRSNQDRDQFSNFWTRSNRYRYQFHKN